MKRPENLLKTPRFSAQLPRLIAVLGILTLTWACYPTAETTFSNPQDSTVNQWLIEFRTGEQKIELTMRYSRKRDGGSSNHWSSDTSFSVSPDQLVGLTREQAMSAGTQVHFQIKRDAGTFNFEGWFKEGNGSGHFTFS